MANKPVKAVKKNASSQPRQTKTITGTLKNPNVKESDIPALNSYAKEKSVKIVFSLTNDGNIRGSNGATYTSTEKAYNAIANMIIATSKAIVSKVNKQYCGGKQRFIYMWNSGYGYGANDTELGLLVAKPTPKELETELIRLSKGMVQGYAPIKHSENFDFGGYVTKSNLRCSDGRIIGSNAFDDDDGKTVPLVWGHLRDSPDCVLGHALLEKRDDGVYGYCKFNNTDSAQTAKELVKNGDITAMSIYANHLKQQGSNVTHGVIREVSLVYAPANPGAMIDNISITHGDGYEEMIPEEAIIHTGIRLDADDVTLDIYESEIDDEDYELEHEDDDSEGDSGSDKAATAKEVFESLTDDQKALFYAMVGQALEDGADEDEDLEQSDMNEGGNDMGHNIFDGASNGTASLSHEDKAAIAADIFKNAERIGSLKAAVADAMTDGGVILEHGITDIESLFPEPKLLNNPPEFWGTPDAWVNDVWDGVRKTPFSRIKSQFADITKDEARAKGYIKGKKKEEEQFSLLKRVTTPQMVYKKQSLDRQDILDITDFNVVMWMKAEMRMKLQEELSRSILIGDGRLESDEDKIHESNIRSILNEDPFYSLKYAVELPATDSTDRANAIIDGAAYAMIDYKGSGSPTAFMSPHTLADMRVAKDKNGRRLYSGISEIASALGVGRIVEVPLMKDQTRTDETGKTFKPLAIIVNLSDYSVGSNKGGETTMFDDFDIHYNKYYYLIETYCSGALTKPASAIVLETETTSSDVAG